MRKYHILFAPTAEKQFLKLAKIVRGRVAQAIAKLADDPHLGKQLKGELRECRSYRVGDYRVIYLIHRHKIEVQIIRIAHRKEVYK